SAIEGFLVDVGGREARRRSRRRDPTVNPVGIFLGLLTLCAKPHEEICHQFRGRCIQIDSGGLRYETHRNVGFPKPKTEVSASWRRREIRIDTTTAIGKNRRPV